MRKSERSFYMAIFCFIIYVLLTAYTLLTLNNRVYVLEKAKPNMINVTLNSVPSKDIQKTITALVPKWKGIVGTLPGFQK